MVGWPALLDAVRLRHWSSLRQAQRLEAELRGAEELKRRAREEQRRRQTADAELRKKLGEGGGAWKCVLALGRSENARRALRAAEEDSSLAASSFDECRQRWLQGRRELARSQARLDALAALMAEAFRRAAQRREESFEKELLESVGSRSAGGGDRGNRWPAGRAP